MINKLKTALVVKDKEVKEIDFDFEKITDNDLLMSESEARAIDDQMSSVFLSMRFHACRVTIHVLQVNNEKAGIPFLCYALSD